MATLTVEPARAVSTAAHRPHVFELLLIRRERWPDNIALGSQHGLAWRTLTSRGMAEAVEALALDLAKRGVGEGDRVVLWLPNGWLTPVYFFALWRLGAVVVPFDREMNPSAGARILEQVEPRLVLGGYGEQPAWCTGKPIAEWWEPQLRNYQADGRQTWVTPDEELAAIYYTSGTTGNPKGCMITHANLCSQVAVLQANIPFDATCRLASILPLSHLFELTCGLLFPISVGAAIHYIPSRRGPDILRVLTEQRATHMIAVPELLTSMAHSIETQLRAKLPGPVLEGLFRLADHLPTAGRRALFWQVHRKLGGQLRLIAAGGAPLAIPVQRSWERLGVRLVLGYGSSECSPVVTCGRSDGSTPFGSVGKPIEGVQVRLTAEGELEVRGPNVMRGYFRDAVHSAEVLHDGWYSTGDIGAIDPQGNVTITGRAKDLIVLPSGMKVWPADVEDVLKQEPEVKDATIIPVTLDSGGVALHAYLIPTQPVGPRVGASDVVTRCNRSLAVHQRVATASWWPEADFPRTSTLKVRRHLLPLPSAAAEPIERASTAELVQDAVGQALVATTHRQGLRGGQTLLELGIDSFGLVDLALAIEDKTGVPVDETGLSVSMTVDGLRTHIAALAPSAGATRELAGMPVWLFELGRLLRGLSLPIDLLYRWVAIKTLVLGGDNLRDLPARVIFAGTHHGFADVPLLRFALRQTPARQLRRRLAIATAAEDYLGATGWLGKYAMFAFGLFPLQRRGDRQASLRQLAKVARAGNVVVIFPQGRHARPQEELDCRAAADFHPGFAYLAEALEAAVVPFGLAGTEIVVPPHLEEFQGRLIAGMPLSVTRTVLAIAFGQPMRQRPGENVHAFASRVQGMCFELTRQAERERQAGLHS